jgi:DNA-binding LytR/AlgR family response regulator
MTKITCVVIDDEPLAIEVLESYIKEIDSLELTAKFSNVIEAIQFFQTNKIDLLFLDIQMPKLTGIDFLKSLQNPPKVILTTAYRDYALQGYDLNVLDYLLKPISFERFVIAINKFPSDKPQPLITTQPTVITNASFEQSFLYLKSDKKMVKVFLKDILYIESLKDYVKVKTTDQQIITHQKISYLEERLPDEKFIRIHRSYIIAIDKIRSYNATFIEINTEELPIGRLYKDDVMKLLGGAV